MSSPFLPPNGSTGSPILTSSARRVDALEVARQAALAYASRTEGVVAAFVAGSMTRLDPPPYADVDLRILLDGVCPPRALFAAESGVPLEWKFLPASHYASAEAVLFHPFRAVEVVEGVPLYDPGRTLARLREEITGIYRNPAYVHVRAQSLFIAARRRFEQVMARWRANESLSLWEYRCVVFWAAEAALVLAGRAPTHRRLLIALEDVAEELGREEIYTGALNAIGATRITRREVAKFCAHTLRLLERLPYELAVAHPYLHPDRRSLWERGFARMIANGDGQAVVFPILTLLTLIWTATSNVPELHVDCGHVLEGHGFRRPHGVRTRLNAAQTWLTTLADLIEDAQVSDSGGSACPIPMDETI